MIDLSLFEPIFAMLEPQAANCRLTGQLKPRTGSRSTNTAPRNAYRTSDGGWVVPVRPAPRRMTEKLLRTIGREELVDRPALPHQRRPRRQPARTSTASSPRYIAALTLARDPGAFRPGGVTIGPIMDAAMLENDHYVAEREALIEVPDEEMPGGWLPMHGMVPRLSATPGILARPAPKHRRAQRRDPGAGLGEAELARLRAAGVVRDP